MLFLNEYVLSFLFFFKFTFTLLLFIMNILLIVFSSLQVALTLYS